MGQRFQIGHWKGLKKKPLENISKGENAGNQHFQLPIMFSTLSRKKNLNSSVTFILSSCASPSNSGK